MRFLFALTLCGFITAFSACASTNNGGHVVGNPLISDSASEKGKKKGQDEAPKELDQAAKEPACGCSTKHAKAKNTCKCPAESEPACRKGDESCKR